MTQAYKKIIKMLLTHVDNEYIPDETISFTVSSIQLKARFGRVVQDQAKDVLINFGNVYGAALDALDKREFEIISLKPKMTMEEIARLVFSHLGFTIWMNPSFFTEDSVQILEGLYAAKEQKKLFFHTRPLDKVTIDYLHSENIIIVPSSSIHSEKQIKTKEKVP